MRLLEICAGSIESIKAAYEGGAQRVELCSALSEDGLTPSLGMIRFAKSLKGLNVHVLIRPRGGDFVYSEDEVRCMEDDIRACLELGADGVVIGALDREGNIDLRTCQRLVAAAQGRMNITFHRAFDVCKEPFTALSQIIQLGCNRLLTSGCAARAEEGVDMLTSLVRQSQDKLIVMPGSGVNPTNAATILRQSGATEIHASARSTRLWGRLETDPEIVRQILQNINTPTLYV